MTTIVLYLLLAQATGQKPTDRVPGLPPPIESPPLSKPGKAKKISDYIEMVGGFVGTVDANQLVLVTADTRTIEIELNDKTIRPKALKPGDYVEVDVAADTKGVYTGVEIRRKAAPKGEKSPIALPAPKAESAAAPPKAPEDESAAKATVYKPPVVYGDGEEPPKLRRGIPKPRRRTADEIEISEAKPISEAPAVEPVPGERTPMSAAPPPDSPRAAEIALLKRAREESANFLEGLPNYLCQQFTTRYEGTGKPGDWRAVDLVSAELVFENGKENYQNLKVNGKPIKGKPEESGAWSTGEFGTVLADIFSPATAAEFKWAGNMVVARQNATQYDFTVDRENSHWKIGLPGQYIMPAYKGSVWVAKDSGRVLRIEMQARQIPKQFAIDTTELAIDYDWVNLGKQRFLLPVKSEVLTCQRGTSDCQKNTIEFRTYRKFVGQSDIIFK